MMKFEKKLFLFGVIVLFISACLLLYVSFGWNDDAKGLDSSFPGNSLKNSQKIVDQNSKNVSVAKEFIKIEGTSVYVLSAGKKPQIPILLLHGAAFSSKTWEDLGTLHELENAGFHAIAVDLPNHGKSEKSDLDSSLFLDKLIQSLGVERPVIISPSFSGTYSVPFVLQHGKEKVSGYIPVAPVIANTYTEKDFMKSNVPTLIIYGENDASAKRSNQLLSQIPNSKISEIPDGSHPAYRDNPKLFHSLVIDFVKSLK